MSIFVFPYILNIIQVFVLGSLGLQFWCFGFFVEGFPFIIFTEEIIVVGWWYFLISHRRNCVGAVSDFSCDSAAHLRPPCPRPWGDFRSCFWTLASLQASLLFALWESRRLSLLSLLLHSKKNRGFGVWGIWKPFLLYILGKTENHNFHDFRIWGRVYDSQNKYDLSSETPEHSK